MKIGFFAETLIPIHANSIEERALGGTETGVIRLAESLQRLGADVTVFTGLQNPPLSTPKYRHAPEIHRSEEFDALIVVQNIRPVFFKLPAKKVFFLTGDGPEQFPNIGLGDKRVIERLTGIFTVSEWQKKVLCEASGFPEDKCFYIGNGVHIPYFEGKEERNKKRLMYSSAPYRGLSVAFEIFKQLFVQDPEFEFHIFSGFDVYNREDKFSGPLVENFKKLEPEIALHPGCFLNGNITQRLLAREYMKSGILFYPNIVDETCCITALEAQAGGCAVIASHRSALPQTVGDAGITLKEKPGTKEHIKESIDAIISISNNLDFYSEKAISRIEREYSWEHVAQRVIAKIS